MDYLYDIGDAVVVKSDLRTNVDYYMKSGPDKTLYNNVTPGMQKFGGKVVHILDHVGNQYLIEEDEHSWWWTDAMFEGEVQNECACESLL